MNNNTHLKFEIHRMELTDNSNIHCVSKVPTFQLSVALSNLNRFSKKLQWWKAYDICYKTHTTIPTHLRHVPELAWEIKTSKFLQIFSR